MWVWIYKFVLIRINIIFYSFFRQRKGGLADGSDLKGGKKKPAGNMFGKKKAAAKTEPEPEKKKNWWSL